MKSFKRKFMITAKFEQFHHYYYFIFKNKAQKVTLFRIYKFKFGNIKIS